MEFGKGPGVCSLYVIFDVHKLNGHLNGFPKLFAHVHVFHPLAPNGHVCLLGLRKWDLQVRLGMKPMLANMVFVGDYSPPTPGSARPGSATARRPPCAGPKRACAWPSRPGGPWTHCRTRAQRSASHRGTAKSSRDGMP